MIETLAALVIAHVAADFVFQTRWMALNKASAAPLATHIAIVWVASWVCLGCSHHALLPVTALALVHLAMDLAKARVLGRTALAYGMDQGVHLLTVIAVAVAMPGLWQAGLWATLGTPGHIVLMIGVAGMGAVFALRGGFYFVDHVAADRTGTHTGAPVPPRTLIENGVIFAGMLALPLLAALAGLMRLSALVWWSRTHAAPRGTLTCRAASLGWAVGAGFGTHLILGGLLALDASGMEVYVPR